MIAYLKLFKQFDSKDEHISYKGNRLVVFDAWRKHQGQPISKQCHELRRIVVFKCYIEGASRERLDFYND